MSVLNFNNELISRDEGFHTDFACLMPAPGRQVHPGQNLRDCQGHRQHQVRVPIKPKLFRVTSSIIFFSFMEIGEHLSEGEDQLLGEEVQ